MNGCQSSELFVLEGHQLKASLTLDVSVGNAKLKLNREYFELKISVKYNRKDSQSNMFWKRSFKAFMCLITLLVVFVYQRAQRMKERGKLIHLKTSWRLFLYCYAHDSGEGLQHRMASSRFVNKSLIRLSWFSLCFHRTLKVCFSRGKEAGFFFFRTTRSADCHRLNNLTVSLSLSVIVVD